MHKLQRSCLLTGMLSLATVVLAAGASAAGRGAARSAALYNLETSPSASFVWFPAHPRAGERLTLLSTSTDRASPLTGWAWDVADNGPFGAFHTGGPVTTATFATPAAHVVRLRVTAADHLTSFAEATIRMGEPPPGVLFPFPVVRIAGVVRRGGVQLTRVAVQAPSGTTIDAICHGGRCPVRSIRRILSARGRGAAWTAIRRLQRFLPAGVSLEFRIFKRGEVGAFTRFTVRRRNLPARVDSCLDPTGRIPIACPS